MNPSNKVEINGGASGSNEQPNGEDFAAKDNDCGKHTSVAVGGARPKVKHLVCNIPNTIGSSLSEDTVKINNNGPIRRNHADVTNNSASRSDVTENKLHNGANLNHTNGGDSTFGMDLYLRNNVNFHTAIDKCPLKVRGCLNNDNNLSSASVRTNGISAVEPCSPANRSEDVDDSSSDTGNEGDDGCSVDDCCIYTYKGDQMADLPSSFFRLDVLARGGDPGVGEEAQEDAEEPAEDPANRSGGSSPEMDFLEMDFDPGPSCEQDSEASSNSDPTEEDAASFAACPMEEVPADPPLCPETPPPPQPPPPATEPNPPPPAPFFAPTRRTVPQRWSSEATLGLATTSLRTSRDAWGHHCSGGDLCCPGEAVEWEGDAGARISPRGSNNLHSTLYHCMMAKRLCLDKQASFSEEEAEDGPKAPVERTMIWSEQEACAKQVTQISTSACGATAVANVLLAMNIAYSLNRVKEGVGIHLRAETAPLPEYLFSRSRAGATHEDLIRGLNVASGGSVFARFFPMYPQRVVSLTRWLAYWMKKGAVPIATLNLQNGMAPTSLVPDAWHHQMVFGVGPRGVYLTNPLECLSEDALWPQLCSPSVLLVRRSDVLARWNEMVDLRPLLSHPDWRWKSMNVLGQVVNAIRENVNPRVRVQNQHIAIPAAYKSGITLVISRESPGFEELEAAQELPLVYTSKGSL